MKFSPSLLAWMAKNTGLLFKKGIYVHVAVVSLKTLASNKVLNWLFYHKL